MPSRALAPSFHHPRPGLIIKTRILILTLSISASVVILLTVVYFLYHLWSSLWRNNSRRTIPLDPIAPLKLQKFTYKELKVATNEFDEGNIIGKGGSATVFRGIAKDGKLYAVKRIDNVSLQSEREFQNELQILGGLKPSSPFLVTLLGYCLDKDRRLLVYEYMPNKSLQEMLFGDSNLGLTWSRRFSIILDVARALEFLHFGCDPPVIHGDIKPSNVLLDFDFRAKVSDFGLSRIKTEEEGEFGLFSQDLGKGHDLWKSQDLSGNFASEAAIATPLESCHEVDFALALQLQATSSSKTGNRGCHGNVIRTLNCHGVDAVALSCDANRDKGKEVSGSEFIPYEDELCGFNGSLVADEPRSLAKQWGKDWWWRQDGSGELSSKDYVMEWIGSQICPSTTNADWEDDNKTISTPERSELHVSAPLDSTDDANEGRSRGFGFGNHVDGRGGKDTREKKNCRKKHKKMEEWWREEHLDEISKNGSQKLRSPETRCKKRFRISRFYLSRRLRLFRRGEHGKCKQDENVEVGEFSFRKGWRKHKNVNARSTGSDMGSCDIFSRELSSTTSMRGTLCYIAPEYGGCGYLMEKADIYSLGVLILVIVSGRRPLHILASPMKLEKANLISWCRRLAQAGNILDLVDERLKDDYDKEQATLCIKLALACLQKMPELRPDITEVVRIIKGETDFPLLPFEFSPSPPSKLLSRSRRKIKSSGD